MNMLKANEKTESLSKEIKDMKNQREILWLKKYKPQNEIPVGGLNSRIERTGKIINKLEGWTIEITQIENKRRIDWKKKILNRSSEIYGIITEDTTLMSLASPKERKRLGMKKYSEKIMPRNFPNLVKDRNLHI